MKQCVMQTTRKAFAAVVAVALALGLSLTVAAFAGTQNAYAANPSLTIKISGDGKSHQYEIYQLLTGTVVPGEDGNATLTNVDWGSAMTADFKALYDGQAATWANDTVGTYALKGKEEVAADRSLDAIFTHSPAFIDRSKALETTSAAGDITTTVPAQGYYLIVDKESEGVVDENKAYTGIITVVVGEDGATVTPKSSLPAVTKKVKEDGNWVDIADANIGDVVEFKLSGTLPNMEKYLKVNGGPGYFYQFQDTMSAGLTFKEIKSIKGIKAGTSEQPDLKDAFTLVQTDTGFTLTCQDISAIQGADSGATIEVIYTAVLNENAFIGNDNSGLGNPNKIVLEYSNSPITEHHGKTPVDQVTVFTFQTTITKINAQQRFALADAYFTLQKAVITTDQATDAYLNTAYVSTGTNPAERWDSLGKVKALELPIDNMIASDDPHILKSGTDGTINVKGLDAGTYCLTEVKAPDGYTLLSAPIYFSVVHNDGIHAIEWDGKTAPITSLTINTTNVAVDGQAGDLATGNGKFNVKNTSSAQLPTTGGIGTTILYVVGTVLLIGAGLLLLTRRRMGNQK